MIALDSATAFKTEKLSPTETPVIENKPEVILNRQQRRSAARSINHNVYTKKYKSKKSAEKAWENFVGAVAFAELKKQMRAAKRLKDRKTHV